MDIGEEMRGRLTRVMEIISPPPLPGRPARPHRQVMFLVTETDVAAIRDVIEREGELSPPSNCADDFRASPIKARVRECARSIAGWQLRPPKAETPCVVRLRRTSDRLNRSSTLWAVPCLASWLGCRPRAPRLRTRDLSRTGATRNRCACFDVRGVISQSP
jgi:hypothetical protein